MSSLNTRGLKWSNPGSSVQTFLLHSRLQIKILTKYHRVGITAVFFKKHSPSILPLILVVFALDPTFLQLYKNLPRRGYVSSVVSSIYSSDNWIATEELPCKVT
jgi:hypothetical protein